MAQAVAGGWSAVLARTAIRAGCTIERLAEEAGIVPSTLYRSADKATAEKRVAKLIEAVRPRVSRDSLILIARDFDQYLHEQARKRSKLDDLVGLRERWPRRDQDSDAVRLSVIENAKKAKPLAAIQVYGPFEENVRARPEDWSGLSEDIASKLYALGRFGDAVRQFDLVLAMPQVRRDRKRCAVILKWRASARCRVRFGDEPEDARFIEATANLDEAVALRDGTDGGDAFVWKTDSPSLEHFRAFVTREWFFSVAARGLGDLTWGDVIKAYQTSEELHERLGNNRGVGLDRHWLADATRRQSLLIGSARLPNEVRDLLDGARDLIDHNIPDGRWFRNQELLAEMYDDDEAPPIETIRAAFRVAIDSWAESQLGAGMAQTLVAAAELEGRYGNTEMMLRHAVCVYACWPDAYPEFPFVLRRHQLPKAASREELEAWVRKLISAAMAGKTPFRQVAQLGFDIDALITPSLLTQHGLVRVRDLH